MLRSENVLFNSRCVQPLLVESLVFMDSWCFYKHILVSAVGRCGSSALHTVTNKHILILLTAFYSSLCNLLQCFCAAAAFFFLRWLLPAAHRVVFQIKNFSPEYNVVRSFIIYLQSPVFGFSREENCSNCFRCHINARFHCRNETNVMKHNVIKHNVAQQIVTERNITTIY